MLKSQSIVIAAVAAVVLFNSARAEARPSTDATAFRFNFSHTELRSQTGVRAVEDRLRSEVARFCRAELPSEVTRLGCERSLGRSALQALRERMPA